MSLSAAALVPSALSTFPLHLGVIRNCGDAGDPSVTIMVSGIVTRVIHLLFIYIDRRLVRVIT